MTYAIGTGVSSIAWSLVFTAIGWSMGRATEAFLGQVRDSESALGIVVLLSVLVAYLVLRRRHVERATIEVLDDGRAAVTGINSDRI